MRMTDIVNRIEKLRGDSKIDRCQQYFADYEKTKKVLGTKEMLDWGFCSSGWKECLKKART